MFSSCGSYWLPSCPTARCGACAVPRAQPCHGGNAHQQRSARHQAHDDLIENLSRYNKLTFFQHLWRAQPPPSHPWRLLLLCLSIFRPFDAHYFPKRGDNAVIYRAI